MSISAFLITSSLLVACEIVMIQVLVLMHQRLSERSRPTWTIGYLVAHVGVSAMGLFLAVVLTVFSALAGSDNLFPYAIGLFGFAVSIIFCIFLGGAWAYALMMLRGERAADPTQYMENPTIRRLVAVPFFTLIVAALVLWLISVPVLSDWTLLS